MDTQDQLRVAREVSQHQRWQLAGLALAAFAILSACSSSDQPPSVADEVVPGLHDRWQGPQPDTFTGEPSVGWLSDHRFGIVTIGSSSCVPLARDLRVLDSRTIHVSFESSTESDCTADMAATTHVFTVPPDASERPIEVQVSWLIRSEGVVGV